MIKNEYYNELTFEQKAFLVRLNEDIQEEFQEQFDLENGYLPEDVVKNYNDKLYANCQTVTIKL
jgi:hypothetical protein